MIGSWLIIWHHVTMSCNRDTLRPLAWSAKKLSAGLKNETKPMAISLYQAGAVKCPKWVACFHMFSRSCKDNAKIWGSIWGSSYLMLSSSRILEDPTRPDAASQKPIKLPAWIVENVLHSSKGLKSCTENGIYMYMYISGFNHLRKKGDQETHGYDIPSLLWLMLLVVNKPPIITIWLFNIAMENHHF
jgi:hypothetical protein